MIFKLLILPEATLEIEDAYFYYNKYSLKTIIKFDQELLGLYDTLEKNPYFQIWYKDIRAVPFSTLPYLILFRIDEPKKEVHILSIFNTYQNTDKYP